MQREEHFVGVMRGLLRQADALVERAAVDSVSAEALNNIIDSMGIVVDDHSRPVRPYADVLIPRSAVVEHDFQEVDS